MNAAFTVSFLVTPELFALNKIPRFLSVLIMYPLYSFAVDAEGRASTFGPNILYALASIQNLSMGMGQEVSRFVGVVLGALAGGAIMLTYFPDDPMT